MSRNRIPESLIDAACDAEDQIDIDVLEDHSLNELVNSELLVTLECSRCGLQRQAVQGSWVSCVNCGADTLIPWGKKTVELVSPCRWCKSLPNVKVRGDMSPLFKLYCGNPECLEISNRGEAFSLWRQIKDWNGARC